MEQKDLELATNKLSKEVGEFAIATRTDYAQADNLITDCIALEKKIKVFFEPSKKSAFETHKKILDMEKNQLEPIAKMKARLKVLMTEYIAVEEAYNDGLHAFMEAGTLGREALAVMDGDDELVKLLERADEMAEEGARERFEAQDYLSQGIEVLRKVKKLAPFDVEMKKAGTNLRKLTAVHSIRVDNLWELVEKVASGKAPIEWLSANDSAIVKTAKGFVSEEDFYARYPNCGIVLTIDHVVR
jgi:hypothetical protein